MVDGVMLLVDASEGPLPQTRFVLKKALDARAAAGGVHQQDRPPRRAHRRGARRDLRPVHRPRRHRGAARLPGRLHQRPRRHRDARPGQRSRATCGRCSISSSASCPARLVDPDAPTQFQCNNLDYNDYVGRLAIGRVKHGALQSGGLYTLCRATARSVRVKITQLYGWHGLKRIETERAERGRHRRRRRHRGDQHRRHHRRPRAAARRCPPSASTSRRSR